MLELIVKTDYETHKFYVSTVEAAQRVWNEFRDQVLEMDGLGSRDILEISVKCGHKKIARLGWNGVIIPTKGGIK